MSTTAEDIALAAIVGWTLWLFLLCVLPAAYAERRGYPFWPLFLACFVCPFVGTAFVLATCAVADTVSLESGEVRDPAPYSA